MDLKSRIETVFERIEKACSRSGRSADEVKLVAVSKKFGIDIIEKAYDLGLRDFGENYAQEFRDKERTIDKNINQHINWHFIGNVQSNKVKYIAGKTHLVHTIDRASVANEFNKRSERLNCEVRALIEVDISGEESKSGVKVNKVKELLDSLKDLKNVNIVGLMGMAPYFDDAEKARSYFQKLRELRDEIQTNKKDFSELSMGMSGDFDVAIEEGATIVRIGSSIFGERPA